MALAIVVERCVCDFCPKDLARATWAFATVDLLDVELFMASARAAERHVFNFKPCDLVNKLWPFATMGQLDVHLFTASTKAAERHVCDFDPEELANAAWALAVVDSDSHWLFGPAFAHCCEITSWTDVEVQACPGQLHQ